MNELEEMKGLGLSVTAISELTGYDRKTVRKYLLEPEVAPAYGPRQEMPSRLDKYKGHLEQRLSDGVWNAQVLLREIRALGYTGGYTIKRPRTTGRVRARSAWLHNNGATLEETERNIREAMQGHLEILREFGDRVPNPARVAKNGEISTAAKKLGTGPTNLASNHNDAQPHSPSLAPVRAPQHGWLRLLVLSQPPVRQSD
jgi:hypothetical protein